MNRRAVDEVRASGMLQHMLRVGSAAPAFDLADQNGNTFNSAALLASGPLVILLLRGRWCPFCIATAEAWNEALPQVRAVGASLLGISPRGNFMAPTATSYRTVA